MSRGEWAKLARTCFEISTNDDGLVLTEIPFRNLRKGDIFTLEAATEADPLFGETLAHRLFRASSAPRKQDGFLVIDCERL